MNEVCNSGTMFYSEIAISEFRQCFISPSVAIPAVLLLHQLYSGSVVHSTVLLGQCFTSIISVPAVFYLHQFYSSSVISSI